MSIRVHKLSFRYSSTWILKDLSFEIPEGVTAIIAGANGSGKTTLLKILATLLEPTRGEIKTFDRSQVAWLGHELGIYFDLTAQENLEFHYRLQGFKPNFKKIGEVLEQVGLSSLKQQRAGNLSMGQKKRLGLAKRLLDDKPCLILDEPFANLDVEGKKILNRLFEEWGAKKKTILFTSHDYENNSNHLRISL